jgi:hypothetical protein
MAIVEVSIVPIGGAGTSLSEHVARALRVLEESSLRYELTAMGTIITGDLDEIMIIVKDARELFRGWHLPGPDDREDRRSAGPGRDARGKGEIGAGKAVPLNVDIPRGPVL